MSTKRRGAFTLVEVLIVVVIMAVLAATIIPQFTDSARDARVSSVKFNLHTMRSQMEHYKSQHNSGLPSADLSELSAKTDSAGTIGTGAAFIYGPYIRDVPVNQLSNSNTVTAITTSPATSTDVTGSGGWLYNATTGEIWIDHEDHYQE